MSLRNGSSKPIKLSKSPARDNSVQVLDLQRISNDLNPNEWKPLGRLLGLKESLLNSIEYDYSKNGLHEVCFQALLRWQQTFGLNACRDVLVDALVEINRRDLTSKLVSVTVTSETNDTLKLLLEEPFTSILQELQELITEDFSHIQLPRVSWLQEKILPLDQLFVELTMISTDFYGLKKENNVIKLEDLFEKSNEKIPKKILIEGDPGYGKTTLVCKLASDWANQKSYIRDKFKLIFVIILRYFEGDIDDAIFTQCSVSEFDRSDILTTIKYCGEKLLFILDGYDEIKDSSKVEIEALLKNKIYNSATILMTSRRGETYLQDTEELVQSKTSGASNLLGVKFPAHGGISLWNKRIQIKGISKSRRNEFLQKYFNTDVMGTYDQLSPFMTKELGSLGECPLFLILLAVMIEETQIYDIKTETSLYKHIFNFVLRRALLKHLQFTNEEIDIFANNLKETPFYVKLLLDFGALALEKLQQGYVSFDKAEIERCSVSSFSILNLGFLTQNLVFREHKLLQTFDPIHKSFLEFLAAFKVSYLCSSNKSGFDLKIFALITGSLTANSKSMFYSFLVGLLGDKAHLFFEALSPLTAFFPATSNFLKNTYSELEETDENIKSLLPFIPPVWNVKDESFFKSNLHSSLIKMATEKNLIYIINWNLNYSMNVPEILCVPCLYLWIDNISKDTYETFETKRISCEELTWVFDFTHENWQSIIERLNKITSIYMNFVIHATNKDETLDLLYNEVTNGRWKKKLIKNVSIDIIGQRSTNFFTKCQSLVKQNRIQNKLSLYLYQIPNERGYFGKESNIQTLINSATNSLAMTRITISSDCFGRPLYLDLKQLSQNGNKKWESLYLTNGVRWKKPRKFSKQILLESLMFASDRSDTVVDDLHVLSICRSLRTISLSTNHCDKLMEFLPDDWESFKTISEITLIFAESFKSHKLKCLSLFSNLKVLSINLNNLILSVNQVQTIVSSLRFLLLDTLYLYLTPDNLPFLVSLFVQNDSHEENIKDENNVKPSNFCVGNLIIKFVCKVYRDTDSLFKNEAIMEELAMAKKLVISKRIKNFFYTCVPRTLNNVLLSESNSSEALKYSLKMNPLQEHVFSETDHSLIEYYIAITNSHL